MSTMPVTFTDEKRFDKNPDDFFPTPEPLVKACVDKLVRMMPIVERFLDPGCGTGVWGREAKRVWPNSWGQGIDIIDRMPEHNPYNYFEKWDFLDGQVGVPVNFYDLVLGNPPFSKDGDKKLARKFIVKGIDSLREYGLLGFILKTEVVHSVDRYEMIYSTNPPLQHWVCVQRPSWDGSGNSSTIEYSFFIWGKTNPLGYTEERWLSWR